MALSQSRNETQKQNRRYLEREKSRLNFMKTKAAHLNRVDSRWLARASFLGRTLIGSVSDSVIHQAPCSVLVVRKKDDDNGVDG